MSHSFIGQKNWEKGWWNQVHSVTDCMSSSSSSSWIGVTRFVRFDEFKIKQTSKKIRWHARAYALFVHLRFVCDSHSNRTQHWSMSNWIVVMYLAIFSTCSYSSICMFAFFFGFAVWVVLVHCNRADRVTQYGVIWRFKYYRKTTCRLTKGAYSADTRPFYNWIYMWSLFVCLFANIRSSITT